MTQHQLTIVQKESVYAEFINFTFQSFQGDSSLSSISKINKTEDNWVTTRLTTAKESAG
jgi:hypothetical protein